MLKLLTVEVVPRLFKNKKTLVKLMTRVLEITE